MLWKLTDFWYVKVLAFITFKHYCRVWFCISSCEVEEECRFLTFIPLQHIKTWHCSFTTTITLPWQYNCQYNLVYAVTTNRSHHTEYWTELESSFSFSWRGLLLTEPASLGFVARTLRENWLFNTWLLYLNWAKIEKKHFWQCCPETSWQPATNLATLLGLW